MFGHLHDRGEIGVPLRGVGVVNVWQKGCHTDYCPLALLVVNGLLDQLVDIRLDVRLVEKLTRETNEASRLPRAIILLLLAVCFALAVIKVVNRGVALDRESA